jgi:hypothetical protein
MEKDELLTEKQQLIEYIQFSHLKKNTENEEKIRKLNNDIKDSSDRLRRAKQEVDK